MLHPLLSLFIILSIFTPQVSSTKKLIFIQELFRHGARFPIYPSSVDNSDYATSQHSAGELTTQGKNMHYQLGKQIYLEYWEKLFKNTEYFNRYNVTKFYFKSTDVNRTIESCQSHLMGILDSLPTLQITEKQLPFSQPLWKDYQLKEYGPVFPSAQGFHPIPIHVQKLGTAFNNDGDFLRAYSPENCPKQNQWTLQNQRSEFAQKVYNNENFTKTLKSLSDVLKRNVSFEKQGEYYDNYQCSLFYNGEPNLPIFNSSQHKRELTYMYVLDLYINLFYNNLQIRTTASNFFKNTLANIKRGLQKKDVQWVIYSAHDTTVANMLAAMNMTNAQCIYEAYLKGDDKYNEDKCVTAYPGYSSSIIFEAYEDSDTTLQTFKVRYLGNYRKIPFCNYSEECSIDTFQKWYDNNIKVESFSANCGLYNDDKQFYKAAAVLQFGIILGFLIYLLLQYLKTPIPVLTKDEEEVKQEEMIREISKSLLTEEIQT